MAGRNPTLNSVAKAQQAAAHVHARALGAGARFAETREKHCIVAGSTLVTETQQAGTERFTPIVAQSVFVHR